MTVHTAWPCSWPTVDRIYAEYPTLCTIPDLLEAGQRFAAAGHNPDWFKFMQLVELTNSTAAGSARLLVELAAADVFDFTEPVR